MLRRRSQSILSPLPVAPDVALFFSSWFETADERQAIYLLLKTRFVFRRPSSCGSMRFTVITPLIYYPKRKPPDVNCAERIAQTGANLCSIAPTLLEQVSSKYGWTIFPVVQGVSG